MANIPKDLNPEYATYVGRISSAWSAVEFHINLATWAIADVAPAIGACLTAQIYTFDARMKALLSLLKLRHVNDSIIKATNQFAEDSRGLQEIRNRIIHDYWVWSEVGDIFRVEVTAPKKLKFEFVLVPLDELKNHYESMAKFADRAAILKKQIYDALPSLPETPHTELHPINDPLRGQ